MVNYIKGILKSKWGDFEDKDGDCVQGKPDYLDGDYMSYIFKPCVCDKTEIYIPADLKVLFEQCNGMRIVLSGFTIFGFQIGSSDMVPYDFNVENINIHYRMRENSCDDESLVFVGSVARDFVLAMRKDKIDVVYLMKNGYSTVIKEYSSLIECAKSIIPRLLERYDDNYNNLFPHEEYNKYPALANAVYSLEELGII